MALPDWTKRLDAATRAKGVDLSKTGFADAAWPISVHRDVVEVLRKSELAVLEGDILKRSQGQFEHTYDGWQCDLKRGESWAKFIQRSCADALAYLSTLEDQADSWFTVVVSAKPDASQKVKSHDR